VCVCVKLFIIICFFFTELFVFLSNQIFIHRKENTCITNNELVKMVRILVIYGPFGWNERK
jgi:hypothetical protein